LPLTPAVCYYREAVPIFEVGGAGVGNVMLWLSGVALVLSAPEPPNSCCCPSGSPLPYKFQCRCHVMFAVPAPLPLQAPEPAMLTGLPLAPPVAATVKLLL